jgi:YrbI family 3-deoxy-D-manno-octulosonate 8-phosphate phosphatase
LILSSGTEQLAKIEAIAFDFDGVFTDNRVYVMQNGEEAVACDRSDGMGISMLRKVGLPMIVISTETNPVVSARCAKLKLEFAQGIDDKLPTLREWAAGNGLVMEQVAFVGNDINDVECLRGSGLGVVVADAYPVAAEAADLVLTRNGGRGAVREMADLWLAARSKN